MVARETIRICALAVAIAAGYALADRAGESHDRYFSRDQQESRIEHASHNSEWATSPRPAIIIIEKVRTIPAWRNGMI